MLVCHLLGWFQVQSSLMLFCLQLQFITNSSTNYNRCARNVSFVTFGTWESVQLHNQVHFTFLYNTVSLIVSMSGSPPGYLLQPVVWYRNDSVVVVWYYESRILDHICPAFLDFRLSLASLMCSFNWSSLDTHTANDICVVERITLHIIKLN